VRHRNGRAATCFFALCATAWLSQAPALAAGILVDDPDVVVKEVTGLLADAKADDAVTAASKYLSSNPSPQANFQSLASAFKIVAKSGKALLVDEVWNTQFGDSIKDRIEYLNFPPSDNAANEFVSLRYTFFKTPKGWQTTNITISAGSQFPPSGWNLVRGSK
jgi:hypothetical protein